MNLFTKEIHILDNFFMMGKEQKILFRGHLKNDQPEGFGIYYSFGDVYLGTFRRGYKHGYGILKCKKGYKIIKNRYGKYLEGGIYIGYFYKDRLLRGKFITRDHNDICIIPIKNRKYNGLSIRKNPSYRIETYLYENILFGKYIYRNFKYNYTIETFFKNNKFEGYCSRKFKDYYENFYYKNGMIQGKSLLHIYKNNISFLFLWENGYRSRLLKIFDKENRLYFPEKFIKNIPIEYLCPIGYNIMLEPSENEFNQIYDFKNIFKWYFAYKKRRDPLTNCQVKTFELNTLYSLQLEIFTFIYKDLFYKKNNLYLL